MKDFENWHHLKKQLDASHKPPLFNEREVWWCSVGVNVGYEILGKTNLFTRPVLILRKYSKFTFLGVPMTSRRKSISAHFPFDFNGKEGSLLLDQIRSFDSRRLGTKMGRVHQHDMDAIKQAIRNFNCF